ncbi:lamin tail domain-containing protein [Candidatus Kaiserbacteria bacterium]|nr:lamin tail domain-containing protein [Candidatus Kaiserbacteria bacterium]
MRVLLLIIAILLTPNFAQATVCQSTGYTVLFINGIFTERAKAESDIRIFERAFLQTSDLKNVIFRLGYNSSHFAGFGDIAQVVSQALGSSISDFDLRTILMQVYPEVTTRKILLVGHSQGTFYTNELYDYLTLHGVPEESIAVYNLATPASLVAGGGKYLTSGNDNLINTVREWTAAAGTEQPLPANILIPLSSLETQELWRGHSFSGEYLAQGTGIIVSDITNVLTSLTAKDTIDADISGCFEPPADTLSYRIQEFGFAVVDPFAQATRNTAQATGRAVAITTSRVTSGVKAAVSAISETLSTVNTPASPSGLDTVAQDLASVSGATESIAVTGEGSISITPEAPVILPNNTTELLPEDTDTFAIPEEEKLTETADDFDTEDQDSENTFGVPDLIPVITPFVGGSGSGPLKIKEAQEKAEAEAETVEEVVTPPLSIISPGNSSIFATTTVTFTGTTTPLATVSQTFSSATTSADVDGNWELTLSGFSEGATTVRFTATNQENIASDPTELLINIDTVSPSFELFSVLQCIYSLTSGLCLSGSTNVNVMWTSTSTDIAYYGIVLNGTESATTTATTTTATLSNNANSTIEIVAYDTAGNVATSSSQVVEVLDMPIVINEIAWAGTQTDEFDEWIELYNRSNYTINLSNIILLAEDGVPYVSLSSTLASDGYYLIERTDDNTTSITADLTVAFSGIGNGSGLSNSGEVLNLIHALGGQASTTLDATPALSSCSNAWCAGGEGSQPTTMERASASTDGTLSSNWKSNNTFTKNGTDAGGNIINGTPRAQNSVSLLDIGYFCSPETESFEEDGFYTPPTSASCTYLSSELSGQRYGDLYRGTVASSTIVTGHSLGVSTSKTETDSYSGAVQGDSYFVAIFEIHSNPNLTAFRNYFQTGANAPPHLNYGIINWTYGTAP